MWMSLTTSGVKIRLRPRTSRLPGPSSAIDALLAAAAGGRRLQGCARPRGGIRCVDRCASADRSFAGKHLDHQLLFRGLERVVVVEDLPAHELLELGRRPEL